MLPHTLLHRDSLHGLRPNVTDWSLWNCRQRQTFPPMLLISGIHHCIEKMTKFRHGGARLYPSTGEAETEGLLWVQGWPSLWSKGLTIQRYLARPCLKIKINNKNNTTVSKGLRTLFSHWSVGTEHESSPLTWKVQVWRRARLTLALGLQA